MNKVCTVHKYSTVCTGTTESQNLSKLVYRSAFMLSSARIRNFLIRIRMEHNADSGSIPRLKLRRFNTIDYFSSKTIFKHFQCCDTGSLSYSKRKLCRKRVIKFKLPQLFDVWLILVESGFGGGGTIIYVVIYTFYLYENLDFSVFHQNILNMFYLSK